MTFQNTFKNQITFSTVNDSRESMGFAYLSL